MQVSQDVEILIFKLRPATRTLRNGQRQPVHPPAMCRMTDWRRAKGEQIRAPPNAIS